MRRRLGALNLAQRIILVVALAAGLRVAWLYLVCASLPSGGWFNYVPGDVAGVTYETLEGPGVTDWPALLAIALVTIWALVSLWLFGLPLSRPPEGDRSR